MQRRHVILTAGVAGLAAAAGAGWALWRQRAGDDGAALWPLRFDRPQGGELALAEFRGQPLLLNFWATWCAPCVKEMPLLDAFHRERRGQGWNVVGLAIDGPSPVRDFLTKVPVGFPIGLAGMNGVDLVRSLGNSGGGLPFSVVFDRRGQVAFRKLGAVSSEELREWAAKMG